MKRQVTDLEKTLGNHLSVKGLVSRIYEEFSKLNKKQPSTNKWTTVLSKHLIKDIWMANKCIKMYSASFSLCKFK